MTMIGKRKWAIPEGYIPPDDQTKSRELVSHEACCILNAGDGDAHVEMMIFFSDRPPAGPFKFRVPAHRTLHLRFNDLSDPETIPPGVNYASTLISDVPVVVQHTRLDGRNGIALMTTLAYGEDQESGFR